MDGFLTQSLERQRVIYDEAGRRLGLSAGSMEKDLWVCWTLRALFRLPSTGPHLTFKGGTSLSKGWKLIDRFSEDIDVVINRESLGFGGADSPEEAPSNKQRVKRLDPPFTDQEKKLIAANVYAHVWQQAVSIALPSAHDPLTQDAAPQGET